MILIVNLNGNMRKVFQAQIKELSLTMLVSLCGVKYAIDTNTIRLQYIG